MEKKCFSEINLSQFIANNKENILKKWLDSTFSSDNHRFSKRISYENPMTRAISDNYTKLLNELIDALTSNSSKFSTFEIMRIKALNSNNINDALSFFYDLKNIIEKELECCTDISIEKIFFLHRAIDNMILDAANNYSQSREKIYQIKIAEINSGQFAGLAPDTACPSKILNFQEST